MKSKTIILSSNKKFASNSPRAIITFIDENKSTDGKLRLYNMPKLAPSVKLGVYYNQKVYSSTLANKDGAYNFLIDERFDLNQNIYCALIDTNNKNEVVLSGGTTDGFYFTDEEDCFEETATSGEKFVNKNQNEEENIENINNSSKEEINELDTDEEALIDACINNNTDDFEKKSPAIDFECDTNDEFDSCHNCDCKKCAYKEYFYSQNPKESENIVKNYSTNQPYITTSDNYAERNNQDCCNTHPNHEYLCKEVKDNYNPNEEHTTKSFIPFYNKNIASENRDLIDEQYASNCNNIGINIPENDIQKMNIQAPENVADTEENASFAESFINNIAEQLDEMFKTYPIDEQLIKIIPNSKIVRVTDSLDNSSYIVGVIYENNEIAYLLYGVPSKYNEKAPAEFGDNYQWLPINPDDPMSDGYYLLYQDASNGKLVPIKVE